jgi:hypothetical protein
VNKPKILSYSRGGDLTKEQIVQNTQVFIPLYGEYGMYLDIRVEFDDERPRCLPCYLPR